MRWKILKKLEKVSCEAVVDVLLANRGLTTKKAKEEFLHPQDPAKITLAEVGLSASQVKKAILRLKKAIKNGEKIVVYGDYDADGICGTACLWENLYTLHANVLPFIPSREEGYGIASDKIDEFKKAGVSLIITVDQGIVAHQQIIHAKKLGIETIVTDHHTLGSKKPKAFAILHTTKLSGVGVAWFFCRELTKSVSGLDLVALGTITDMVPLIGANRSLAKHGLPLLQKTERIGLQALYQVAGIQKDKLTSYEVGFIIGPRINASGRIDDPMDPLRLLCLKKDLPRAREISLKLDQNNRERQELTQSTTLVARESWLKEKSESKLIFVYDASFNEGIIGLVAQKLTEEFYRPAIVACGEGESRASARSIPEFNIIEAVRSVSDILGPHGGHPAAAGFSFQTEKITLIKSRLQEIAQATLAEGLTPTLTVDTELKLSDLTPALYRLLEKFAPFGIGNPTPVFASCGLILKNARLVGSGNKHLKLTVQDPVGKNTMQGIGFNLGKFYQDLTIGQKANLAYNLVLNEWNGTKNLELRVKDIKS